MLINTMEQVVDNRISDLWKRYDCCKCDECRENVKCIALNKLPAKYVSTQKGELFSKLNTVMDKQNSVDADVAVIAAIEFVSEHPRHSI